jgi:hypothetical protein
MIPVVVVERIGVRVCTELYHALFIYNARQTAVLWLAVSNQLKGVVAVEQAAHRAK